METTLTTETTIAPKNPEEAIYISSKGKVMHIVDMNTPYLIAAYKKLLREDKTEKSMTAITDMEYHLRKRGITIHPDGTVEFPEAEGGNAQ